MQIDNFDHKDLDFEFIFKSMPGYVFFKDKEFKYLWCNEVVNKFLGFSSSYEIVGKTDYDFGWDKKLVDEYRKVDEEIVQTAQPKLGIEEVIFGDKGKPIYFLVNKIPLLNKVGEVIGIVGVNIDITSQKEAERLQQEAVQLKIENQVQLLQEKEKLITLAHTVAHDISSPLSALNMMMYACDELQENKRAVIKRAIESILDIANNLLSTYRNTEQQAAADTKQRQPVLISDAIIQLLSEKKTEYSNHPVHFETVITNTAQFAFAELQASQFRRALSNLVNNAVDALDQTKSGLITLTLTADTNSVTVIVQDNGKGMPAAMREKMLSRQRFTEGKQHGHGLGLQQVWDTLDANHGTINIDSTPGIGTTIQLIFPRIEAPSWIAQTIYLATNSLIVILDDEESIHGAWDTCFAPYLKQYSNLNVHHFKQGKEALDFFNGLNAHARGRIVFLSDYELLRQAKNGLQVIEESGIKNAILVTSYYTNASIREKAIGLKVKILPKQMASIMPIEVEKFP